MTTVNGKAQPQGAIFHLRGYKLLPEKALQNANIEKNGRLITVSVNGFDRLLNYLDIVTVVKGTEFISRLSNSELF